MCTDPVTNSSFTRWLAPSHANSVVCRLRRRKDLNSEELNELNQLEQNIRDKKKQYHELEDVLPHENGWVSPGGATKNLSRWQDFFSGETQLLRLPFGIGRN